jgi:hypothetical protein
MVGYRQKQIEHGSVILIRKPLDINSTALINESRAMVIKAGRSGEFTQSVLQPGSFSADNQYSGISAAA